MDILTRKHPLEDILVLEVWVDILVSEAVIPAVDIQVVGMEAIQVEATQAEEAVTLQSMVDTKHLKAYT